MKKRKRPPARSCVVCRSVRDKRELLRVVRTPSGDVAYDPSGKMNGRGAYVCKADACVEAGIAKGRLAASLQAKIDEPAARALRQAVQKDSEEKEEGLDGDADGRTART